jgi:putative component of membrane protein insertase Oxa1/YidC/SpoIIIJ protein YidD
MKYLLLIVIRVYWLMPKRYRKCCLFKESCSKFVYRNTVECGFKKGVKCLIQRIKTCRPKYAFFEADDGTNYVILADNSIIERTETTI